ncbi:ABC-F family ATP-binding cassette domain-containing protein [Acerihabitans sp. TG2]|uniref:ABC-F family ATP-binding cassette domain-containing protein n=1 Tax=Acerihabitans sp. TG2 TaxID=3096008 RepID=UPI002B231144|nr:ABC-F family ATP-binding cassette domain-containing protein [Acerihabitans sp. TG2]MEA9391178.1 ABC-F family ATP-binding cassette domain-containing protein [Acerihabitans sp. TG2]
MSTLLSAQSVSYETPFGPLLTEVSFNLKKGDRVGLIGHNGSGKSTFLNLLNGNLPPTTGSVIRSGHCQLATIEQHLPASLKASGLLEVIVERLPENQRISESWRAERLLATLDFEPSCWSQVVSTLSGGQHTRLMLARALILEPDLLLLDEPGNHLDLPTLLWLGDFLQQWNGSFILVSHDAVLLDSVTNSTWILRDKTLHYFSLRCSEAREALAHRDKTDAERRHAEQREINRVEKSASRLALWGKVYDNEGLARKAKQMEKQIDRMKDDQTPLVAANVWRLNLLGERLDADRVLALTALDVSPARGTTSLFSLKNLQVKSGDRIAIMGRNGCGKSSLLRLLWRSIGKGRLGVNWHPRTVVGYYDQGLQQLKDSDSLSDALSAFAPLTEEQRKMALIGAGFPYLRHQQKVGSLSGGERSRLLFVGLTLAKYSLLLLDEPTNHLDMAGKEELAETLRDFAGAVLLVSHDRALIENSCNRFWLVHEQKLDEWHQLEPVYALLGGKTAVQWEQTRQPTGSIDAPTAAFDEDLLLARLCALEQQLESELTRKTKHQKPALQQQIRADIEWIMQQLGIE